MRTYLIPALLCFSASCGTDPGGSSDSGVGDVDSGPGDIDSGQPVDAGRSDSAGDQPPHAEANGPYAGRVGIPLQVTRDGSFDPEGAFTATWDMGDGTVLGPFDTVETMDPFHTYGSTGTYTVRLTITDASGLSAEDTAAATISALASGYPNEPSGFVRFAETSLEGLPPSGTLDGAWVAWTWGSGAPRHAAVSAGDAPVSPPGVFQFTFSAGIDVGSGVAVLQGWDTSGDTDNTRYRAVYESGWFKIPSSDFETPGAGMKLLGYWGVGQAGMGTRVPAQVYSFIPGSSTFAMTEWNLSIRQQNHIARDMPQNMNTGTMIHAGQWHNYEILMILNDIGSSNGTLSVWLDGVQIHEHTDVMYRNAGNPSGFYGRRWDPIWGGIGPEVKSRDDHLWIDHIYISGQAM